MLDEAFFYTSNTKKAELFLKYGANINAVDSDGETRLMNELRSTPLDDDFVIMLLEHGIDVNIKNNHNNTALDIFNRQNQKGWYQEDKKEIKALLKAKGAKSGAEPIKIYILGDRYPQNRQSAWGDSPKTETASMGLLLWQKYAIMPISLWEMPKNALCRDFRFCHCAAQGRRIIKLT